MNFVIVRLESDGSVRQHKDLYWLRQNVPTSKLSRFVLLALLDCLGVTILSREGPGVTSLLGSRRGRRVPRDGVRC